MTVLMTNGIEQRKQHLVCWKRVCRPKSDGGLGIRPAVGMNKALLAKLGWRLLHDVDSLWARVLRSKYKVTEVHDQHWLVSKGTWSSTWRSICLGLREIVVPGLNWVIGDGKDVRVWTDKWLLEKQLRELIIMPLPHGTEDLWVCDLWRNGTGWWFEYLEPLLPSHLLLRLQALVIDNVTGAKDRVSWGGRSDGKFTLSDER